MPKVMNVQAQLFMAEKIFFLFSLLISISILYAIFNRLTSDIHPIFTIVSLLFFLFSSIVCTFLASLKIIVSQLSAIFINLYFLHRIPLLYFIPEWMDYPSYLSN
jgi:hypothetical protein